MNNTMSKRTFRIDGNLTCLSPKDRDEVCIKEYGMTFEEWQKANKPMSDDELKAFIMAHIKK